MIGIGEVEKKEEVDPKTMSTIEFGTSHRASFEPARFKSQSCWGLIEIDSAMAACVVDPTCHGQKTWMN